MASVLCKFLKFGFMGTFRVFYSVFTALKLYKHGGQWCSNDHPSDPDCPLAYIFVQFGGQAKPLQMCM